MTEARRRSDPAVKLAAKFERYAKRLTSEERRNLEALLVMAMDPLDRQTRRLKSALTADEAQKVATFRRDQ